MTASPEAPASTLRVDTVVGFESVAVNGVLTPVSAVHPMAVTVGTTVYTDPDFMHLYSGKADSGAFRNGEVIEVLGVTFITTTEAPQQSLALTGKSIRRAIVCGQGALIEGDFQGLGASGLGPDPSHRQFIDGVCLLVREPLDRFQEIVSQSWKWRGGFCVPTDVTADPTVLPTASPSYWKRAVVIECL